ncbi:hypothetical protein L6R50_17535, partial [Myxococcota bacterium]|nr:hypothetical protein [Myxococcota bacterium]
ADPGRTRAMVEAGILPWYTAPDMMASLWRPVSSATHRLDYALWPDSAPLMHAHSLLWAAALAAVAAALYRRVMGAGGAAAAGLAALLYAADDARGIPVGWLANRNALIAAALGLGALWAHDRWRRDGWRPGAALGPALLGVGLLAGEAALAATAWVFAWAVCLDRGPARNRLATLLPYAAVVAIWRMAYVGLGYGAYGSGVYIDPGREPARFLEVAPVRAILLLMGQWTPVPADVTLLLPASLHPLLAAGASLALAALALLLARRLRGDPVAGFFATGMLLAIPPICATFPSNRLLAFVGFGAMGLLARFLLPRPGDPRPWGRADKGLAWGLLAVHGVLGPLSLLAVSYSPRGFALSMERYFSGLPADPGISDRTVLALGGIDLFSGYAMVAASLEGKPPPGRFLGLAPGIAPMVAERPDERTLVLKREGGFFTTELEGLFLDPDRGLRAGDRVELPDLVAEVAAVGPSGHPTELRFRLGSPLDSPRYVWLTLEAGALVPFELPPVGGPPAAVAGGVF